MSSELIQNKASRLAGQIATFVGVLFLLFYARIKWVAGDNASKLNQIQISLDGECKSGTSFKVYNSSKNQLQSLEFELVVRADGRSSTYTSGRLYSDVIIESGDTKFLCFDVDTSSWPTGENFKGRAEPREVIMLEDGETVSYPRDWI